MDQKHHKFSELSDQELLEDLLALERHLVYTISECEAMKLELARRKQEAMRAEFLKNHGQRIPLGVIRGGRIH